MEGDLLDWEVLHNSDSDSNSILVNSPQLRNLEGIEGDTGGMIRSDYFSLDNQSMYAKEGDASEEGSIESDNPSWIDPKPETQFRRNNSGDFWSDSGSDRSDDRKLSDFSVKKDLESAENEVCLQGIGKPEARADGLGTFKPDGAEFTELDRIKPRVGKVFGSLSSSSSSSSSSSNSKSLPLSSLWSLTDDEIEKREWNRDKNSPQQQDEDEGFVHNFSQKKKAINFGAELENDLDDLDDEDAEEEEASASSSKPAKPEDYNDEEWEIKSSIGRDCTLDYEEEEDAYDKVAVGRDKNGDRLYMKDVNDYDIDADSCNTIPTTFKDFSRDPRANHIAAKLRLMEDEEATKRRLEEDAEAAKKIDSLHVSDSDATVGVDAHSSTFEDGNPKSILKRKDAESNSKSQKRVRFDSECCKNDCSEGPERTKDVQGEVCLTEEEDAMVSNEVSDYPSGIPDYMRNPSKYTRYTFDTSDVDDESNRLAYMDFLRLVRRSDGTEPQADDGPGDLTKPVTFIPRKKIGDVIMGESGSESKQTGEGADKKPMHRRGLQIGIAAGDTDDGVCAMDEDEPQTSIDNRNISQRSGRQYRMKSCSE